MPDSSQYQDCVYAAIAEVKGPEVHYCASRYVNAHLLEGLQTAARDSWDLPVHDRKWTELQFTSVDLQTVIEQLGNALVLPLACMPP